MTSFNPFAWTKKIIFLTESLEKNNKQLKELIEKQDAVLVRLKVMESVFEQKNQDDEKYKSKVDDLNDFMNQMKGRIAQASSSPPRADNVDTSLISPNSGDDTTPSDSS